MTILWMDGFDHYGAGTGTPTDPGYVNMLAGPYSAFSRVDRIQVNTTRPRTGSYSIACIDSGYVRRSLGSSHNTAGFGFALYMESLPSASNALGVRYTDASNNEVCIFSIQTNGSFGLGYTNLYGDYVSYASHTTPEVTSGTWNYIEVLPNLSAGTFQVHVNGALVWSATGIIYTSVHGSVSLDQLQFGCFGNVGGTYYFDDVVCWDTAGTINNTFIGDRRVATLFPDGDTSTANWHLNGASSGYQCINQAVPDGDTTYLSALSTDSLPESSTFTVQDLPGTVGYVTAIQTYTSVKKTDTGTATVAVDMVSGSYTATGTTKPVTVDYQYQQQIFETDPATGTLWTPSGVNSARVSVRRVT